MLEEEQKRPWLNVCYFFNDARKMVIMLRSFFAAAFLNSHEAFGRHRDMYLGHPQKRPVPNREQKTGLITGKETDA